MRTICDHLIAALLGFCGACMYVATIAPREVILPRYDRKRHTIELNIVGYLIIGMGAAVLLDWARPLEMGAGLLARPVTKLLIESLPKMVVKAILSWLPLNRGGS